ncbi:MULTISPECIES: hypothetical protein [unclassified Okeania]|uniref:hypothetical protein n=1 Tax=unclassified Okeania TaxID=2634635 RepID=UPI0013BE0359|nr:MULTISPECIES: hypothetical protein [unclassified Okeania]NEP04483.1 hypothetical protein [Okeania sp. SIO4D6]NEP43388.1 hypothetical protein [Okeania sp. SIO2H7]NET14938.1 hypothetical protein [Okeania sp. SIO1H6]NEP70764.1 hypothetical protein [Okeania sp. SIO2G5]NEP93588.1 hypothetical protein [Okeania sp. SIO2F5]
MTIIKDSVGKEIQHIYGAVHPDGNIMFGEGFRSRRIWQGTYLIEFERPFVKQPAPVCTIQGPEWKTFNMSVAIVEVMPYHLVVVTSSPDRPDDCGFTLIAFGEI